MSARPDPIRLELMKNAFAAVADEMAATVIRTARSSVIKEAMDFSTGLLDPDGNLVAQGLCLPVHMGSFPRPWRPCWRSSAARCIPAMFML